jgi:Ti-type conjugative transfer relaxase TraA
MAIAFARPEYVGRSSGANACCKSAYNARNKIEDLKTGVVYNWQRRGGNIYHDILLPGHVDAKFKNAAVLANEVERAENRKDSQLYVEWLLALPKEEEITLDMKKEIIQEFINRKGWVKEGLGVQIDIHEPHEGDVNWHAHLLVTTRRFSKNGSGLEVRKAVDLQPEVRFGKVQKTADIDNHNFYRQVLDDKFKEWGLELRADLPGEITQEHIGPIRMRSVMNQAAERNEERRIAEIAHLSSGASVLDKVTRHMSTFSEADLMRAVKCVPNIDRREELVAEALADESIRVLCQENGEKTGYFTTEEVRKEEEKILRLSSYVANNKNVFTSGVIKTSRFAEFAVGSASVRSAANDLPEEQQLVLQNILTSKSALHIIRGRAGVGKSHVLGRINSVARSSNLEVIGLAPTHKAKEGLSNVGFARTDTVKGMLFKLHNARFSLPKNSLLVVDEAGMIGNDDFSELLRVAATRQCSVILSGDERQLSSVQRGGMFEVLADKYGSSTILQIQRQKSEWGRSVAMAFSQGEVRSGVAILEQEDRIKWDNDASSSMQSLLLSWQESDYAIENRLIMAVKNKDVAALNHGVRQYLKLEGKLTGQEIEVAGNHYMKGDRILISTSNKNLGLVNGDIGVILEVSKDRFIISMNGSKNNRKDEEYNLFEGQKINNKIIGFNPSEYSGFRHSYATTVFKAQGASIKDVYVFHDGVVGIRNSYVALSRNINELKLYVNSNSTRNIERLIRQLSYDPDVGSSLNFFTEDEINKHQLNKKTEQNFGLIDSLIHRTGTFIEGQFTKLVDKYLPKSEYYNYKEPSMASSSVEQVLDEIYDKNDNAETPVRAGIETEEQAGRIVDEVEERLVVGGDNISNQTNTTNIGSNVSNLSNLSKKNVTDATIAHLDSNANLSSGATITGNSSNRNASNAVDPNSSSTAKASVKQTAKERFYARADYVKNKEQKNQENIERYKEEYRAHIDKLRGELRFNAESVALNLLGTPNRKLSTKSILKYGNKGSLAVRISGMKAGAWYDFEKGEGGDMFALVQQEKRCDFKESVEYLSDFVGISRGRNNNIAHLHNISDRYVDYHKEQAKIKAEEEGKIRKAENLYTRSKVILPSTIAFKYLTNTRKIDVHANINSDHRADSSALLSSDVRTCAIYDQSIDKRLPAIVAFARDKDGHITGGQQILLDSKSCDKAVVNVPKKSFGKISGSFVEISKSNSDNITIIAEGLETALSIKQSDIDAKIVCSLGIHNIKDYSPKENEMIIIAADNDGESSTTNNTIIEASKLLEQHALLVRVVKPEQIGDFNDILQRQGSSAGGKEIREIFAPVINSLTAKTLDEFFANEDQHNSSFRQVTEASNAPAKVKEDLADIRKYNISEKLLLNSFKNSYAEGLKELSNIKEKILHSEKVYDSHVEIIEEIKILDSVIDKHQVISELVDIGKDKGLLHLEEVRNEALGSHLKAELASFNKDKEQAVSIGELLEVITKEQKFLANLAENHKSAMIKYSVNNNDLYIASNIAKEHPQLLQKIQERAVAAEEQGIMAEAETIKLLTSTLNIQHLYTTIDQVCESRNIESNLNVYRETKNTATTSEGILEAVAKEQEYLSSLYCNVKYPEEKQHLLPAIMLAHYWQKKNIINGLSKAVEYLLEHKLKTDEEIVSILQQTTNLDTTYSTLDKLCKSHHTETNLELFRDEKEQAKSLEELFNTIQKEHSFLKDLNKNNKYARSDENLLSLMAKARSAQQDNIISKLQELTKDVMAVGIKDEVSLCDKLKKSADLTSTYTNLDKAFEYHNIESNLSKFREEKGQAQTSEVVIKVIAKEQEFLSNLHDNLKYPESYSDKSLEAIKQARIGKDTIMQDLQQVTSHILSHQVMSQEDLLKSLQDDKDAHFLTTELTKICQDHYSSVVHNNIKQIINHGHDEPLKIGKHKFDCPIKYLEHEINNPTHAYADIARFKRNIPRVQEHLHQMELAKGLNKGMGGISM